MKEQRIPTPEKIKRPDLVARSLGKVYVADFQVVCHKVAFNTAHRNKIIYYKKPTNRNWLKKLCPENEIFFTLLSRNWWGEIRKTSAMFLSDEWRFSKTPFELLPLTVLEAGACAHQNFEKYSFRQQSDNQALMTAIKERRPIYSSRTTC